MTINLLSVDQAAIDPATGDITEPGLIEIFTDDLLAVLLPGQDTSRYTTTAVVADGVLSVELDYDTI